MSEFSARSWLVFLLVTVAVLQAQSAFAQSAIAGVVKDTTGSVLPGVTVEVRSPALIEQVRTTVTDGTGQYRIVDLQPGIYTVTFTLTGFSRTVREGVELTTDFTANIDGSLSVGALDETITVTAASPVVDVQNTTRREVISATQLDALPAGRSVQWIGQTIPSVNTQGSNRDVGGTSMFQSATMPFSANGSRDLEMLMDGLPMSAPIVNGIVGVYSDMGSFQEMAFQVMSGAAERQVGGVVVNQIGKTGGNQFSGRASLMWTNSSLQSDNITPELEQLGLTIPFELTRFVDSTGDLGGPILRDRLWFYGSVRLWGIETATSMLHDGKEGPAGTPVPDKNFVQAYTGRLTAQLNSKNKLTGSYNRLTRKVDFWQIQNLTLRPEATQRLSVPGHQAYAKWTSTLSNRLLIEGGSSFFRQIQPAEYQSSVKTPAELPPYGTMGKIDTVRNLSYDSLSGSLPDQDWARIAYLAQATYATGTHAVKWGFQYAHAFTKISNVANGDGYQQYASGVPVAFVALNTPLVDVKTNVDEQALFLQDSWILRRLTLNPGIRWDRFKGYLPAQHHPAGRWTPERTYPALDNVPLWNDVSVRFGAAYDLFGNGSTAIKGSIGTYPLSQSVSAVGRFNPVGSVSDSRNWDDLNGDNIAQENEIGPSRNPTFARQTVSAEPGFEREYEILSNISLDRELFGGVGLSVAYNRRDARRMSWNDNVNQVRSDYEMLTVPDPRGNGKMLPVFQIIPANLKPVSTVIKNSDNNARIYNGVDVTFRARLTGGMLFTGGTSTGRLSWNQCEIENPNGATPAPADVQNDATLPSDTLYCDSSKVENPFRTTFKMTGSAPLPWYGLQVSGVYQSRAGNERIQRYTVTRAQLPQLTTASSVVVRLNEPGTLYFPYVHQLDLTLGSRLPLKGNVRILPRLEVFNVFNANPVTLYLDQYPALNRPQKVLDGRLLRLSVQIDY